MLKSRIPQITVEIETLVEEALEAGAEQVAADARVRVPVATGALRDAIHVNPEREGVYVVAGDTEVFYAHMIEHGTVKRAPHPFLVPALEENRDAIMVEVKAALRRL